VDPDIWSQATRIFSQAVELDGEERDRHLEEACRDAPALRSLVGRLLAADLDVGTVLEQGPNVLFEVGEPELPESLGPYKIVGELGRGGMGTVLLGQRADGRFDRSVAIKVISGGFDSQEIRERFEAEVRILAGLEHPGIARLYDAGVDDGRPYLVMEYVEGQRIDRFCDDARLGVEERLRIFQQVCRAVQFAHQNLVIHRDLKPSNILVDDTGRVRLLDFGIAKLTEEGSDAGPQPTRFALTPEYASPEQLRGKPLSTVSDVYTLGIVLYEMLTGRRPYEAPPGDLAAAVESTGREPSSPSTVVARAFEARAADGSTRTVTPEAVGSARASTPERLRKALKGDLDQIVLKSLRPDPSSRYPSAEALAEDVGRFLDGLPVTARPDSFGYRAGRFVRRHRVGVSAASVAALALLATSGIARRQANVASDERDSAQRAYGFLEDLLTSPDPFRGQGVRADSVRMIDFIDYAAKRIDEDLTEEPVARARMLTTLGRVYLNLGRLADAEPVLAQAVAANRAIGGASPELAEAQLYLGFALDQNGSREEGELSIRASMATLESIGGIGTLQTAQAQEVLARSLMDSRRLDEAEPLLRASYDTRLAISGDADPLAARSVNMLGALHSLRGDQEGAAQYLEEAVAVYRRADLTGNPDFAVTMGNLSATYLRLGRLEDADRLSTEALELMSATLGDDHLLTASTVARLAGIRSDRERPLEADSLFRHAIATLDRVAADNINGIPPLGNYAVFLRRQGRLEEAQAMAEKARDRSARVLGEGHPLHSGALLRLGDIVLEAGRPGESAGFHERAVEGLRGSLGEEHPQTQEAAIGLARSWLALGRRQEAEDLLRQTRSAAVAARGEDDRIVELVDQELAGPS
jgi:serine/threonine protein kinase/tetratricopeptide (TPR) repeat protein